VHRRLTLFAILGLAALPSGSVGAAPSSTRLIDCTCYDISRVDTTHGPRLVLGNQGYRGWNLFDVSSDRTRVLFSHLELEIADVNGAHPRVLFSSADVYSAALSPDGRLVAFTADTGCNLCVVPAGGGSPRDLGVGHVAGAASWSPDSRQLVVPVRLAGSSKEVLMLVDADGSGQRALTGPLVDLDDVGLMARSIWSPGGDRIEYAEGTATHRRLHVLRVSDGHDTVIAQGGAGVWSPDGRKLAFLWKGSTLTVVDADGRHLHVLDPRARDGYGFGVAWSSRGRWIAYRTTDDRGENGADDLVIAHPDGTHRRQLVRGVENEEIGPIYWSRDGQTILYTHLVQQGE